VLHGVFQRLSWMDLFRVHLMIAHLPIFGSLLGAVVMANGLKTGSSSTKKSAYMVFFLTALGVIISFLTGDAAEDTAKSLREIPGTTLKHHEDFAFFALLTGVVLGTISILGLVFKLRSHSVSHTLAVITLLLAIFSFALMAWTGYLGIQIRHTEPENGIPPAEPFSTK
jgi:hypothetical protein